MSASGNDGHDLKRLLMAAPNSGAEGQYDHAYWSVRFAPETPEALRQLATVHESMHMALNDSTAFGSLLHVYAALLRAGVATEHNGQMLEDLIRQCIVCHESFATWISIVLVGQGQEDDSLLAGYPRYLLYFETARHLLRGLNGPFLRNCAANAAFRLCMQGTGLDVVMRVGLADFVAEDIGSETCPDRRLDALSELTGEAFWAGAWEGLRHEAHSHPEWPRLEAHKAGDVPFTDLLGRELDSLESTATEYFYAYLARALDGVGIPSLAFNGHQGFTLDLLAAANRLYPNIEEQPLLVAAPPGPVDDEREQIERYAQERYQIRNGLSPARFRRFRTLDGKPLSDLLSGLETAPHLFVAIRQGMWLLQHYHFDAETENRLQTLRYEPLVVVRRRSVSDAGTWIDLAWLETPDDLSALVASAGVIPIFASLSLTSLAIPRWAASWYAPIESHCRVSLLFDLSPFVHLRRWSEEDAFAVRYAFMNVASEGVRHVVFLCKVEDGYLPPLLAPCSELTAKAIAYFLHNMASAGRRFLVDKALASELGEPLGIWLGHLLREEMAFDFLGAQAVASGDTWQNGNTARATDPLQTNR